MLLRPPWLIKRHCSLPRTEVFGIAFYAERLINSIGHAILLENLSSLWIILEVTILPSLSFNLSCQALQPLPSLRRLSSKSYKVEESRAGDNEGSV